MFTDASAPWSGWETQRGGLGRRVVVMTPRPGRVSAVVENPGMGSEGYRVTEEYFETVKRLRRILADEGVVAAADVVAS
jgi:4-aminobutyrate aminotransferase-like enzyme